MASRSGIASRLTLGLTQLAVAAALTACGGGDDTPTTTVVNAHPTEQTVLANGTATFTIRAEGDNLEYQWQHSTDGGSNWSDVSGATNATLVVPNVSTDQDGHLYRARVTGDGGTVTTTSASLTVKDGPVVPPTFTVNLASQAEITEGADITLAVTASGTNLTYRWETSPAGSSSWTTLAGTNAPLLLLNDVPLSDHGRRYRVIISNDAATITSQIATLGVKATSVTPSTPTVTAQPAAVSVKAPAAATFTVNVSGSPTPTVQWQSSATNSSNPADWTDISGATELTYRVASTSIGLSGNYYRAKVSNSAGTAYSQAAQLTVTPADVAPSISTQPTSQTVTVGAQATFTVAATGTPTPTIQWQISSNGGSTWTNINGATSATYSFTTTTVGTSQYRAVASNGVGSAKNSNAATLTVNAASGPPVATPADGEQCISLHLMESVGAKWRVNYQYSDIGGKSGTVERVTEVQGRTDFNGYQAYQQLTEETKNIGTRIDSTITTKYYRVQDGKYFEYGLRQTENGATRTETYSPPIERKEFSLNIGKDYFYTVTETGKNLTARFRTRLSSIETIATPSGDHKVCRVDNYLNTSSLLTTQWLLLGKGIVIKEVSYSSGSAAITLVANSVELNGERL